MNIVNEPFKFNKVISTVEKNSDNGDIIKSITIRNEQITDWIPYNGKPFSINLSLYPVTVEDNARSAIDALSAIEKSLDPTKLVGANLINKMDIFTNIASTVNDIVIKLVNNSKVKDEINYRITLEQYSEEEDGNTKLQEGFYLLTDSTSGIKPENVKIDALSNVTIAGIDREYSYMIIRIQRSESRKDLSTFAFYDNIRQADKALMNKNLAEMDKQLNEFKIKLYDNDRFTDNEKKQLWIAKYSSYAAKAAKADRNYKPNQLFFDDNDQLLKFAKTLSSVDFAKKMESLAVSYAIKDYISADMDTSSLKLVSQKSMFQLYSDLPVEKKSKLNKQLTTEFKIKTDEKAVQQYLTVLDTVDSQEKKQDMKLDKDSSNKDVK